MHRLTALLAGVSACLTGTASAAPFDIVHGLDGDSYPEAVAPASFERGTPTVLNGVEADPLGVNLLDRYGARAATPGVTTPLRSVRTPVSTSPVGRFAPLLGDLLAPVTPPSAIGGLDLVPTPGTVALLGMGGLGLVARRGG
jgi:hypothetical protein